MADKDFLVYAGFNTAFDNTYFRKEAEDIISHGLSGEVGSLYNQAGSTTDALQTLKALEFDGPFVGAGGDLETETRDFKRYGFDPYFYGIDEPDDDDKMADHILLSNKIHAAGGKVFTAILKQTADRLDDPGDPFYDLTNPETGKTFREEGITSEPLDIANYHATYLEYATKESDEPLWDYIESLRDGTGTKNPKKEYFYRQFWFEKPLLNRLMPSFFLWTSHLDGVAPFTYSWGFDETAWGDPFDDMDSTVCSDQGEC